MKVSKTKLGLAIARSGYNLSALADASGVSRATLSYINNGKTCKPDILFKIAKALETKPEDLIEEV